MLIHPRTSLRNLGPECRLLSEGLRYDMGRLITLEDPEFAIKFAYLEHIVRITTPAEEARSAILSLPTDLAEVMTALVDGKDALFQEAFIVLEQNVSQDQLAQMEIPDVALHLIFASEEKVRERDVIAPDAVRLPHIYIAVLEEACAVLYSTHMTFVDGYNPATGQQINPVLSGEMLETISKELYWQDEGSGIPTQTEISPVGDEVIIPKNRPKPAARQPSSPPQKPPARPEMKAMVIEWRSLDLKARKQRRSREACEGLTCGLQ